MGLPPEGGAPEAVPEVSEEDDPAAREGGVCPHQVVLDLELRYFVGTRAVLLGDPYDQIVPWYCYRSVVTVGPSCAASTRFGEPCVGCCGSDD